jgi:hypothetical protein
MLLILVLNCCKIAYVAFVRRQVDMWGSVVVAVIVDMWGSVVVVVIVDMCGMYGAVTSVQSPCALVA